MTGCSPPNGATVISSASESSRSIVRGSKGGRRHPHTLRHSFASIAADLGYSELVIAGLLGHSAGSVTSGYVHLDSALVSAADRVSTTIAAALAGKETAVVIPLREGVVS